MTTHDDAPPPPRPAAADPVRQAQRWVVGLLQLLLAVELGPTLYHGLWLNAFLICIILFTTLAPWLLARLTQVEIPAEFQLLAVVFVFAALFLGEIHGFYTRFWWWDVVLHTSSGLLLGLVGFLLVHVLNAAETVAVHMRPRFVALFAVVFAVAMGALWEIFEFVVDQAVGSTMQKPTPGDPSGLSDTMWDMIVNVAGAVLIGLFGWWYLESPERSFIERWIRKFVLRNPHLFRR